MDRRLIAQERAIQHKSERDGRIRDRIKAVLLYVKEICAYVKSEFNLTYTRSWMTKWLQADGFRYKKPHGIPAKADKTKQEAFIEYYKKLKSDLPKNEVIYFLDASHPQNQAKLAYGCTAKGTRKPEKMTACQKRVNLIAGINLADHHIEYAEAKWINGESIAAFLKQRINAKPAAKKIHAIWDNAGYHKSQAIRDFVKTTNIECHKSTMLSRITDNFQRLAFKCIIHKISSHSLSGKIR